MLGLWLLILPLSVKAPRPPAERERKVEWILRGPVEAKTAERRQSLLQQFAIWMAKEGFTSVRELARRDLPQLSESLEAYGVHCYAQGWTRITFAETLNGLV